MTIKFEAIKIAYKQTKSGDVVSFRIHPEDYSPALAILPLGEPMTVELSGENGEME